VSTDVVTLWPIYLLRTILRTAMRSKKGDGTQGGDVVFARIPRTGKDRLSLSGASSRRDYSRVGFGSILNVAPAPILQGWGISSPAGLSGMVSWSLKVVQHTL
jgi:hypothetical protein